MDPMHMYILVVGWWGGVPLEWAHVERKTETQWDVRKGGGGVEFAW